jgi:hypothetical protein
MIDKPLVAHELRLFEPLMMRVDKEKIAAMLAKNLEG